MGEEGAADHVDAVRLGGAGEPGVDGERAQAVAGALGVGAGDDLAEGSGGALTLWGGSLVGDVHTEVPRQPGQPVGVALAHRAHPPRSRALVDLGEQGDRLAAHRRRSETGEGPLPRVGEQHGRQRADRRARVLGGRDHDHALGPAAQPLGCDGELPAAQPDPGASGWL